jgi:hypothetical protein
MKRRGGRKSVEKRKEKVLRRGENVGVLNI